VDSVASGLARMDLKQDDAVRKPPAPRVERTKDQLLDLHLSYGVQFASAEMLLRSMNTSSIAWEVALPDDACKYVQMLGGHNLPLLTCLLKAQPVIVDVHTFPWFQLFPGVLQRYDSAEQELLSVKTVVMIKRDTCLNNRRRNLLKIAMYHMGLSFSGTSPSLVVTPLSGPTGNIFSKLVAPSEVVWHARISCLIHHMCTFQDLDMSGAFIAMAHAHKPPIPPTLLDAWMHAFSGVFNSFRAPEAPVAMTAAPAPDMPALAVEPASAPALAAEPASAPALAAPAPAPASLLSAITSYMGLSSPAAVADADSLC